MSTYRLTYTGNDVNNLISLLLSSGTAGQILRRNSNNLLSWDNAATETEIGTAVTNWLTANIPTGTTVAVDSSLTISGAAADSKTTGDKLDELDVSLLLQEHDIPDTTQTITYDLQGKLYQVLHQQNNTPVRTDTFTYGTNTITEIRALRSGETLTIVTNLTTLETTVTRGGI